MAYAPAVDPAQPGRLLFLRDGTLWAQPFDVGRMQPAGEPVSVGERVAGSTAANRAFFSVSANGVLVTLTSAGPDDRQLTWFDRAGNILGTVGNPGAYSFVSLSPDATRAALVQNGDIWLMDLARGTETRFTYDPASDNSPRWSPDGGHTAFASNREGKYGIYEKASNGGAEELLYCQAHWST